MAPSRRNASNTNGSALAARARRTARGVHEMEVQVRLVRAAAVADLAEDVAAAHAVAGVDSDAVLLEVGVDGEATAADVLHHLIAHELVERGLRRVERGRVVRQVVASRHDRPGRHGMDVFAPDEVALVAGGVAAVSLAR